ncbi:Uncharacterised protein [Mycobacteroides abscessus subsp. abscessus]|nr:Uncharacterised protein [Mycobacteroides abscessus subsp. abscessus]
MPAVDSTRPGTSSPGVAGSRESGTTSTVSTRQTRPTGTTTTNTLPHQKYSSSRPPTIGPSTTPMPDTAPQTPIAAARSVRSTKTLVRIDSVDGKISAAPRPITVRAAISCPVLVHSAPSPVATVKITRPSSSVLRLPKRSPRLPAASTSAAKVSA